MFAYCASSGSDFLATSVCGYKPPDSQRANTFNGSRVGTTTPGLLQEQEELEDERWERQETKFCFFQELKGEMVAVVHGMMDVQAPWVRVQLDFMQPRTTIKPQLTVP